MTILIWAGLAVIAGFGARIGWRMGDDFVDLIEKGISSLVSTIKGRRK